MKKIPTLFVRNPEDMSQVIWNEINPECEWVFDATENSKPTRKWDGTCVLLDVTGMWWARREWKPGQNKPDNFVAVDRDPKTNKTMGWIPMEDSSFKKWHAEAASLIPTKAREPGTYELIGPKINGNPEKCMQHQLINHAQVPAINMLGGHQTYESVRDYVIELGEKGIEGVVWHHEDGRMAKIKARDYSKFSKN